MKKMISIILIVFSCIISFMIFKNKDYSLNFINHAYNYFNNYLYLDTFKDSKVNASLNYDLIEKYNYKNASLTIYCPFDGTIIESSENKIIIKCDNGYYANFLNIINIQVSKYDVVKKDDIIAYFIDYFTFYFIKDGITYSYEEII